jgi:hypothetical protein
MTYVFGIDVDTIFWLCVCADVAPRGCEVEFFRVSTRQEPGRLPRVGERHQHEDAKARPAEVERETRRHWCDDLGVRPAHAPPTDVGANFEDIRRHLEAML